MSHSAHFIAGLIVGEGCFRIIISEQESLSTGVRLSPAVHIGMHDVDRELLESVCEELGSGSVKDLSDRTQSRLALRNQDDIRSVIDTLDRVSEESSLFRESYKYKTYQEWRELAQMLLDGEHHSDPETTKEIIRRTKELNQFGQEGRSADDWCSVVDRNT